MDAASSSPFVVGCGSAWIAGGRGGGRSYAAIGLMPNRV